MKMDEKGFVMLKDLISELPAKINGVHVEHEQAGLDYCVTYWFQKKGGQEISLWIKNDFFQETSSAGIWVENKKEKSTFRVELFDSVARHHTVQEIKEYDSEIGKAMFLLYRIFQSNQKDVVKNVQELSQKGEVNPGEQMDFLIRSLKNEKAPKEELRRYRELLGAEADAFESAEEKTLLEQEIGDEALKSSVRRPPKL